MHSRPVTTRSFRSPSPSISTCVIATSPSQRRKQQLLRPLQQQQHLPWLFPLQLPSPSKRMHESTCILFLFFLLFFFLILFTLEMYVLFYLPFFLSSFFFFFFVIL